MKTKNRVLIVLFAVFMGTCIWWLMQSEKAAPPKIVKLPQPAKAAAPPIAQVEMPKLPPVVPSSNSPTTADAEKAPDQSTPPLYVPPGGVKDLGILQFTEGKPITVFTDDGVKWILTAYYFPTKGQPSDKITIISEGEDPTTGQPSLGGALMTSLVVVGQEHKLSAGNAQLKLVPVMEKSN